MDFVKLVWLVGKLNRIEFSSCRKWVELNWKEQEQIRVSSFYLLDVNDPDLLTRGLWTANRAGDTDLVMFKQDASTMAEINITKIN